MDEMERSRIYGASGGEAKFKNMNRANKAIFIAIWGGLIVGVIAFVLFMRS